LIPIGSLLKIDGIPIKIKQRTKRRTVSLIKEYDEKELNGDCCFSVNRHLKKEETDGGTTPHEQHNEVLQIITSDKRTNKHQQK
jgi:translation initiation factor 1 (eIF-1/SUI1)